MELDPCRLCGSVHSSALIKQTHQCISILSQTPWSSLFRSINYSSAWFWEIPFPRPPNGASSSQGPWMAGKPSHPCRVLGAEAWGGICVPLLHLPDCFCQGADPGNHMHRQQQAPQTPAIHHMKMKYTFNWCWGLGNNLSSLNLTTFFFFFKEQGWCTTTPRCLLLTATQINLFGCAKMSIVWNTTVLGHCSIFFRWKTGEG